LGKWDLKPLGSSLTSQSAETHILNKQDPGRQLDEKEKDAAPFLFLTLGRIKHINHVNVPHI
jgi:hypothetical protein